jgi:hypothetical protein
MTQGKGQVNLQWKNKQNLVEPSYAPDLFVVLKLLCLNFKTVINTQRADNADA